MRTKKTIWSVCIALAFIVMAAPPARAECDAFPKVPWWGNLNHVTVESYVTRKYDGNWKLYLTKWSKQADKLKDVYKRESSVFVRYKGKRVKIAGNALANYIKLVAKRVTVIQCLASIKVDPNLHKVSGIPTS